MVVLGGLLVFDERGTPVLNARNGSNDAHDTKGFNTANGGVTYCSFTFRPIQSSGSNVIARRARPGLAGPGSRCGVLSRGPSLQGYLAHKKMSTPLGPP